MGFRGREQVHGESSLQKLIRLRDVPFANKDAGAEDKTRTDCLGVAAASVENVAVEHKKRDVHVLCFNGIALGIFRRK